MPGAIAVFDYNLWQTRYPNLAQSVNSDLAQIYFNEATLYLRNDGSGRISDATVQLTLLNMITAHIALLNATINGQAPSGLVGPISDAAEGSVHVAVDLATLPGSSAWFNQTTYGIAFWQATRGLRTGHYRRFNRYIPSGGAFGGGPVGRW